MAHEFNYARPTSLAEAIKLKDQHRDKARVLAGGTDLIVNMKEGMMRPELLIDIKDVPDMHRFAVAEGKLFIGAAVTFCAIIDSAYIQATFPMLSDAAKTVASTGVRSRATMAGNICSAVPSLDSAPPLFCYNATVHCASVSGTRDIPIGEWFLAPRKTALQDDEIVTGISLTIPQERNGAVYLKLGRYGGEDLAQAGWAIYVTASNQYRIAHCALSAAPKRAQQIEQILNGKPLCPELIEQAVALVAQEISPITDIRSSKEYRLHVSGVMLKRGLLAAKDRLDGKCIEPAKLLGGIA
jgi:carbon-monoxide dehydrogenase medium subunit